MNEHERERIAAAMNQLRPDWPVRQLKTLLDSPQLADRPRRDVTVALSWVACESGTANPYRVLEAGPWWRAVAVDGTSSSNRDNPPKHERCSVCSLSEARCKSLRTGNPELDHEFERADVDRKRGPDAQALIVRDLKDRLEPTATRPEPTPRQPSTDPRAVAAREAIAPHPHPEPTDEQAAVAAESRTA